MDRQHYLWPSSLSLEPSLANSNCSKGNVPVGWRLGGHCCLGEPFWGRCWVSGWGSSLNHGGKDHRLQIPRGAEALPGLGAHVGPDGGTESHLGKPGDPMGTAVVVLWERPAVWPVSALAVLPPTGLFLVPWLLFLLLESVRS